MLRIPFANPLFLFQGGIAISDLLINEEITAKEVRLIGTDGSQLGIVPGAEALKKAYESDLDLVMISANANPPVCKIMDYSKYRFDQMKKEKEARKNQKTTEVKEVRLSPNIDDHDVETKVKSAIKFLEHGDRVKISVKFRGREMTHQNLGKEVMDAFVAQLGDAGVVEKAAKMEGRNMHMLISPLPAQAKKKKEKTPAQKVKRPLA